MELKQHSLMEDARDGDAVSRFPVEDHMFLVFRPAQIVEAFAGPPKQRPIRKMLKVSFDGIEIFLRLSFTPNAESVGGDAFEVRFCASGEAKSSHGLAALPRAHSQL